MIRVCHIIHEASLGGACRALLATAQCSAAGGEFEHVLVSLVPAQSKAVELARRSGIQLLSAPGNAELTAAMERADIVQVHWWNHPEMMRFLSRPLPSCRLSIFYHVAGNTVPHIITPALVDFADLNIPCSPYSFLEQPVFQNLAPETRLAKVRMVYGAADLDRLEGIQPRRHEGFNVGYIGTVDFVKMHRHYLRMSLGVKIPDVRFVVCGEGGALNPLRSEVASSGHSTRFQFQGYVEDIKPVLEILDIYGYPLCEDTYAASELNLQEVMFAGIPPVVFPYGGVKCLVVNNFTGLVVHSEKEYAQAIEHLYHDSALRHRLGANAAEYARQIFGARNAARELNAAYAHLMRITKHARPAWGASLKAVSGSETFLQTLGSFRGSYANTQGESDIESLLQADAAVGACTDLAFCSGIEAYKAAYPRDAWLRFWSALAWSHRGRPDIAILEFTEALQAGFTHLRVYGYLAQAASQLGSEDRAMLLTDLLRSKDPVLLREMEKFALREEEKKWEKLLATSEVVETGFRPRDFAVSVLVSTYASESFMRECLDDLESQTIADQVEIIVVDAASPQNERAIVAEFQKRYDNIRYIRTPERIGVYPAWNLAIVASSAPLLTPFSTNDRLNPKAYEILLDELKKHPEAMLVYGDSHITDIPHERFGAHTPSPHFGGVMQWPEYGFEDLLVNCRVGPHPVWRKSLHAEIGYFDGRYKAIGDQDFWTRIGWKHPLRHIPLFTGLVWFTPNSLSGDESAKREIAAIQNKHLMRYRAQAPRTEPGHMPGESVSRMGFRPRNFKVTAIVSTYNSERFLRGCLEDLESQSLRDVLEIVVVETGSQQNESAIVAEFQQRFDNIVHVKTVARETVYWAWNRGLQEASGRYVTNANTDDRHHPEALQRLAEVLDGQADSSVAYADCDITDAENGKWGESKVIGHFHWPEFDPQRLFQVCYVGPQPLWRKSLHERYGYFDASLRSAGDYDFWLRLCLKERFTHVPETLGLYYLNPKSLEHQDEGLSRRESELARARNWPPERGALPRPTSGFFIPAKPESSWSATAPRGPLVSVIVPTRDRPELLRQCVESILAQTYPYFEIIVVNDAGVPVDAMLSGMDPLGRVHWMRFESRRERSAARNAGLSLAAGEYVAYLDDDDLFYPDHLETLVAAAQQTRSKVVYSDAHRIRCVQRGGTLVELEKDLPYSFDFDPEDIYISNCVPTLCVLHHRSLFQELGGFDETLTSHEDWELWIRYSQRHPFHHVAKATCAFRWDNDRGDSPDRMREFQRTRRLIYERYAEKIDGNSRLRELKNKALGLFEREIARTVSGRAA